MIGDILAFKIYEIFKHIKTNLLARFGVGPFLDFILSLLISFLAQFLLLPGDEGLQRDFGLILAGKVCPLNLRIIRFKKTSLPPFRSVLPDLFGQVASAHPFSFCPSQE
jgi:hypothetical protein